MQLKTNLAKLTSVARLPTLGRSQSQGGVPAYAWKMADGVTPWKNINGGYWLRSA